MALRIAFMLIDRRRWAGGFNYQANLFRLLAQHQPGAVAPVVFHAADAPAADLAELAVLPGVELAGGTPASARTAASLAKAMLFGRDRAIVREFDRCRIDLVFESANYFGWRAGRPVLAWIPDLQHRALPRLFRANDYWRRELGFRVQQYSGRTLLFSSEDSRESFVSLYGVAKQRTHVARFAVVPGSLPTATEARAVADAYGLPEVFVYMPNQLWQHKNHLLVAEALGLLHGQGPRPVVMASGATTDPRDPGHFRRLTSCIEQLGVSDQLLFPGQIPYAHVVALLRACSTLLNPSLFEGWSTTVEEARAMGVPMLLSDIRVHREQVGEAGSYFDPRSAAALAGCLAQVRSIDPLERERQLACGMASAAERAAAFTGQFLAAARAAVDNDCRP